MISGAGADSKKKLLITGATGFIGRALFDRLIERDDYNITVISRRREKADYFTERGASFIQSDITKRTDTERIKESFEIIIHSAGCVSNGPEKSANPLGTENICRMALKTGAERLIYISSVSVVSANKQIPLTEDLPYSGSTPYAESKIEAEKAAIRYREKGVPTVILRPPIVYGKDEPHFMPALSRLLKLRIFPLPNGGRARFHMVYVENLVDAIIFALKSDKMFSGTYFTADSEALTVKEVFTIMAEGLGVKPPLCLNNICTTAICRAPIAGKKFRFFTKERVYSTEKIEALGFRPGVKAGKALLRSTGNNIE